MIYLRPHHLICIHNFLGYGYDNYFISNMSEIVSKLTYNALTKVNIVKGEDSICSKCPNKNISCMSFEKVSYMDNIVIDICKLSYDKKYVWRELSQLIVDKIFKGDNFYIVCWKCEWFNFCRVQVSLNHFNRY